MTDTPNTPPVFPNWIHASEAFFKAHERFILIVTAASLLFYFGIKVVNEVHTYQDNKHTEAQAATNAQIAIAEAHSKDIQTQLAQMKTDYETKILSLEAQIAKSKQTEVIKQKQDAALPMPELAKSWESTLVLPESSITPESNGNLSVTPDAAHATVNELDKIGPLMEQLVVTGQEFESCKTLSAKKDEAIVAANSGWDLEKKGRVADAKVANDNKRKSFWRGTKVGAAVATVAIIALRVAVIIK